MVDSQLMGQGLYAENTYYTAHKILPRMLQNYYLRENKDSVSQPDAAENHKSW